MDKNILLKIKKLMALADGSDFPEETATALAKAQILMLKHKVDQATLEDVSDNEEDIQDFRDSPLNEEDAGKKKKAMWKARLASTLCKHNGCYVFTSGANIVLVGKPSDVATIRYMYGYCIRAIDKLTKSNCKGQGRTYANNFRYGCVKAIDEAMKAEQDAVIAEMQAQCDERGLVVINSLVIDAKNAGRYAQKKFSGIRSKRTSYSGNEGARAAGQSAGSGIYKGRASGSLGGAQKKLG